MKREWRKDPEHRLAELLVNLLRSNRMRNEDVGRALFAAEDGELLSWLGAESDDEQHYIEDEPRKRQVGWGRWMRSKHRHGEEDER